MMRGWTFKSPTLSCKKCVNKYKTFAYNELDVCKFDGTQPLDSRMKISIFYGSELEKGGMYRQLEDEG